MSPQLRVKVLESTAILLMAAALGVFEQAVRARVKLEESGDAWVEAARVKEPITDGIPGEA